MGDNIGCAISFILAIVISVSCGFFSDSIIGGIVAFVLTFSYFNYKFQEGYRGGNRGPRNRT